MEEFIAHWGYLAILAGTFFEGEAVLLLAGAMAHSGLLSLPWVMVAAFTGSLLGDQLWFHVGQRYGKPFIAKRPHLAARTEAVQKWLHRYGMAFVISFRFMVGLRSVTPVLLGASDYPLRRFAPLNIVGGAVWAVCFGYAGYGMGAGLKAAMGRRPHIHEHALIGITLALILAGLITWRVRRSRRVAR